MGSLCTFFMTFFALCNLFKSAGRVCVMCRCDASATKVQTAKLEIQITEDVAGRFECHWRHGLDFHCQLLPKNGFVYGNIDDV